MLKERCQICLDMVRSLMDIKRLVATGNSFPTKVIHQCGFDIVLKFIILISGGGNPELLLGESFGQVIEERVRA